MIWLFKVLGYLPLSWLHGMGTGLGWLAYWLSPAYARRIRENLARSAMVSEGKALGRLRRASVAEAGKSLLELCALWSRPLDQVLGLVCECEGWEHVEAARAEGKGVIFMTPHLGCFEIWGLYAASRLPMIALYRPPRLPWLQSVMETGRGRGYQALAPTDMSGVRKLLAALKRGEAIGILPDQVPGSGEGEWADFFGRPAYTMTLVGKLVQRTGATVIMGFAERLEQGRGYRLRFMPLPQALGDDAATNARLTNAAVETLIRMCPQQYLWSYNRYKVPRQAAEQQ